MAALFALVGMQLTADLEVSGTEGQTWKLRRSRQRHGNGFRQEGLALAVRRPAPGLGPLAQPPSLVTFFAAKKVTRRRHTQPSI